MANEDLRERYEQLVKLRDSRRQEVLEAKAHLAAADARLKEVAAEAEAYGATTLEELETLIASEEKLLFEQIQALENALKDEKAPMPQPAIKLAETSKVVTDLDDLLSLGSH